MRKLLLPLLLLALAAALAGCPGDTCNAAADCATGKVCVDGVCADCTKPGDCSADYGAGATCSGGTCRRASCAAGQVGCACLGDGSCSDGECLAGTCVDCARGSLDCICYDNGTCDRGLICGGERCEACVDGVQGCPCRSDGTCDGELICDSDVCVVDPCPQGTAGCACRSGGTCDDTLYCTGNNTCAACSDDVIGCPCSAGQTCSNDLVCDGDEHTCRAARTCVDLACALHRVCQPAQPGLDAVCLESCEAGFRYSGSGTCDELNCLASDPLSIAADCATQNRSCEASSGAGAVCGACLDSYTDEGGTQAACRAILSCADLDCAGQHRSCQAATGSEDAACLDCVTGFVEEGSACLEATCGSGTPGSILASCTALHRGCDDPFDTPATCTDCTGGYLENAAGDCQLPHSCDASDLDCAASNRRCEGDAPLQYCGDCLEGTAPLPGDPSRCVAPTTCRELVCGDDFCVDGAPGHAASCVPATCTGLQAADPGDGSCVSCVVSCNASDTGETGRIWPVVLSNGHCLCETRDGFYWDEGDRQAKPCDDDGDGWVRESARSAVESIDPAMHQNARCQVRQIDRVVLRNELGQRLPVYLCAGNPAQTHVRAACGAPAPIPLYESVRNDDQNAIDLDVNAPPYWTGASGSESGRRLRASELNGLTRACVDEGADYNHNGVADLREWHGMPAGSMSGEQAVLAQFSYLVELHRGWYERGTESLAMGQYVIAERSRCDGDFPLTYGGGSAYWRACTRSRDVAYNGVDGPTAPDFGLDFARWSCDAEQGSCPVPPPPTDAMLSGAIPDHGLCRDSPLPPPVEAECLASGGLWPCVGGRVWRGMSHHSQFRCVLVRQNPGTDTPTLAVADFTEHRYAFDRCRVDCPAGDPRCSTDCTGPRCSASSELPTSGLLPVNPASVRVACDVELAPSNGEVGLAAVRFQDDGGAYQRGCIDEWVPTVGGSPVANPEIAAWRALCPGWNEDPVGTFGDGIKESFGQLACGCGLNYGGLDCEVGCPDLQLSVSPGYLYTPRQGYWMCADFSSVAQDQNDATYGPALVGQGHGSTWVVRDDLGMPGDGQPLCQRGDCLSGYVLR